METQIYFDYKNNKLLLKGVNAGYKLLEHNEFTDVDGTLIGVVLAKSKTQYATWRYSFYPKGEYLTGLNFGHYFSNEISAKTDYFERLSEMGKRLKSEISKSEMSKTCYETDEDMEI